MKQEFQKHTVTIQQSPVSYWTYGDASKPTVLLIHGFRGNHFGFTSIAEHLDSHNVIIPDLPGYGESQSWQTAPHTIEAYADWLHEFCITINIEQPIVVGHSFGATIALVFAHTYGKEISQLILMSPVVSESSIRAAIGSIYYSSAKYVPSLFRRTYLINPISDVCANLMLFKTGSMRNRLRILSEGLHNTKKFHENVIFENFASLQRIDPFSYAPSLTMPVCIIAGTDDVFCKPSDIQRLCSNITNITCTYLDDEGHLLPLEQPKRAASALYAFISSSPA